MRPSLFLPLCYKARILTTLYHRLLYMAKGVRASMNRLYSASGLLSLHRLQPSLSESLHSRIERASKSELAANVYFLLFVFVYSLPSVLWCKH